MKARLIREFETHNKKHFEAILKTLFPGKVVPFCAKRIGVPLDKSVSHITSDERKRLHRFCKDLRFQITSTRPMAEAIVTAGGVHLSEVHQGSMQSKLIPGLYIVGELLDLDADTGGYNLQIAWSTGWLAAEAIIKEGV
jgi:predicted Rossmann fold flavoprotein